MKLRFGIDIMLDTFTLHHPSSATPLPLNGKPPVPQWDRDLHLLRNRIVPRYGRTWARHNRASPRSYSCFQENGEADRDGESSGYRIWLRSVLTPPELLRFSPDIPKPSDHQVPKEHGHSSSILPPPH
jgi:hypothetical protein